MLSVIDTSLNLDIAPLWTFILVSCRLFAILLILPGIGTDQIPESLRYFNGLLLAFVISIAIPKTPMPEEVHLVLAGVLGEFTFGAILGLLPSLILSGLLVSGQIIAGVIGLGQANMIDRSLGESVSVLARINMTVGTIVFLLINGHHVVFKAASTHVGFIQNLTQDNLSRSVEILTVCFTQSFELSIALASPILIATLASQFLLGLITKFVPTINVFIISLPLSVLMGFYILSFTIEPFSSKVTEQLSELEEFTGALVNLIGPPGPSS